MADRQRAKLDLLKGAVIVGIDIAKHKHWARITDRSGYDLIKPFAFDNTRDGFERLVSKVVGAMTAGKASRAVIGMEATGHYGKPLMWFLLNEQRELDVSIVLVNPMHVKRQKELVDNSPTKTDRKDTGVIAKLVRDGNYLRCLLPAGVYADLRELQVTRQNQRRQSIGSLNRLRGWLDMYFPEFVSVFKDPTGMAATWVLRNCPTPVKIQQLGESALINGLKDASRNRVGTKRAQQLREAAAASVGIPDGTIGAQARLNSYLDELAFWQAQLARTEAAMAAALEQTGLAECLLSIPGIGIVTAAGFLGEIGDPDAYASWRQIQKLAGLNLVENSSGQRKGQRGISKRGRPGLRALLYQASLVLVARNPEFQALYRYLLNRAANPLKKKQALVAVALKLLRVMFGLIQRKTRYDAGKVLGAYRQRQLALAA